MSHLAQTKVSCLQRWPQFRVVLSLTFLYIPPSYTVYSIMILYVYDGCHDNINPSYVLYVCTGMTSLTPTGGSSLGLCGGSDLSMNGTPSMWLPPQEIVPYNPGPYTGTSNTPTLTHTLTHTHIHTHTHTHTHTPGPGPGHVLGDNFLAEVSLSGTMVQPGDHVPALRPRSSSHIDWRKPITNGT